MRRRIPSDNGKENTMSKNAMAGAVTLCGVGLCMMGGAMLMQSGGQAQAALFSLPASAAAVSSVASAQAGGEPTVVWYGAVHSNWSKYQSAVVENHTILIRAWSDGRIEARQLVTGNSACEPVVPCGGWWLVNDPSEGYGAAADINADELVDGVDLASVLNNWGSAPRVPFPPSDCPLNLINP
jgi:hypothetical protein